MCMYERNAYTQKESERERERIIILFPVLC